jgi:hypothetical protein
MVPPRLKNIEPIDNTSLMIEATVRGYHVYKEIWLATLGEELPCVREVENHRDTLAVAVVKSEVVGHLPRRICHFSLRCVDQVLNFTSSMQREAGQIWAEQLWTAIREIKPRNL